ncbi:glycosyltransferase [Halosimplex halobium]|uniref:glycosyltransferase n=1 Tax=Halosimplex halobium TaxID=3396618 RepID=UPI003F5588EF
MADRTVLVCNPTAQFRTTADIVHDALGEDERTNVTLLTVACDDPPDGAVCYAVVDVPFLNYTIPGLSFLPYFLRALAGADVVVVVEYEYLSSAVGVVVAKAAGKRVILTTDAVLGVNWRYGHRLVDAAIVVYTYTVGVVVFNAADEVVVLCEDHWRDVQQLTLHDDIHVVPNGIDTGRYVPASDGNPDPRGGSLDLLYVGRLDPIKELDLLIETVDELQPDLDVHLNLVGNGDSEARLRALCDRRGVSDAVTFHGWQDDVKRYYREADLFVLSSRSEGQPTVVLEAQAAGVPVVSTDVGCVRELLGAGAVVTDRDPSQFAAAIRAVLDREYDNLQRAARRRAVTAYDRRRTKRHYSRLINGTTA